MKHTFLAAALAAASFSAWADRDTDLMFLQCEEAMKLGACAVAIDARNYPNATVMIGTKRVSTASYLRVRGTGQDVNPDGTFKMCSLIKTWCPSGGMDQSDDCTVVRYLWKKANPTVSPPGGGAAIADGGRR